MRDTLRALRAIHLAPARTAHAWFEGAGGASGGTATAPPPAAGTAAGDPPAGAAATPPADPPADLSQAPGGPDLTTLQKELRDARKEAAAFRTKLKQYEDTDAAAKQAQMSEAERLQAQLAELQRGIEERDRRLKEADLRDAVKGAATRLGFADPADALAMLDRDAIEYTDDGRPRNLDHVLGEIIRSKPYLKASFTATPDLGQGNRGAGTAPLTREAIARMSSAEINARWPEVQAVMQKG